MKLLGRIPFIVSMVIFGTIGLFVRGIALPSSEVALFRALLAILLIGAVMLFRKRRISLCSLGREGVLLFLSGAAMGFNWILLFEAYKHTTVSVATLCYYFAPVLVTILSPVIFKERLTARGIVSFVGATVGIVLITGLGDGGGEHGLPGVLLGLGAATLYATVILLNKGIERIGGIERTFLQFISAAVVLLPYVIFTSGFSVGSLDPKGVLLLIAVGILHTGLTYILYFSSLSSLGGQEAAILSYIDPLVALLCSVTFLEEPITPTVIVGAVLILGFTLLSEIDFKKIFAKKSSED